MLAAALVCVAIATHHAGLVTEGEPHHGSTNGLVVELCLGVFTAVGAAVAARAVGTVALGRWRAPLLVWPRGHSLAPEVPTGRSRAGPSALSLLCVRRR
jgi:hypothetical protein